MAQSKRQQISASGLVSDVDDCLYSPMLDNDTSDLKTDTYVTLNKAG